ncbi:MAG: flavodoxin [Coriobacteriia bacterium]|nr:MAG: flavodoxin [Coriobacteriia bacterium]
MKPMRKALVLALGALLMASAALCITACGQGASSGTASSSAASSDEANKTLVVYYSATGNTAKVAEVIVNENDMDVSAIMPEQPYSTEDLAWTDENSRVSKEHSDPALQDVALLQDTPDNWDSYETVIIGYPIWWGQAAYPVASFVKANDFTGKTVIPFCTSASSDIGDSAQNLADLAKGGEWMGGMRFPSDVNSDEVRQWIDDLGLENQNL